MNLQTVWLLLVINLEGAAHGNFEVVCKLIHYSRSGFLVLFALFSQRF